MTRIVKISNDKRLLFGSDVDSHVILLMLCFVSFIKTNKKDATEREEEDVVKVVMETKSMLAQKSHTVEIRSHNLSSRIKNYSTNC